MPDSYLLSVRLGWQQEEPGLAGIQRELQARHVRAGVHDGRSYAVARTDLQHGGGGIEFDCGPRAVGKSLNWPTCHFLRPRIQEAKART